MSVAELLPCPFCGGRGMRAPSVSSDEATEVDGCRIKCVNDGCPIDGKSFYGAEAYEEAVAWWNRRPTPSSPVSAPSPAGGVREALARRLYIAHTHATNRGPDRIDLSDVDLNEWFDSLAKMPLSGPSFVALWNAMADAALSSPATPEPVSDPAGEVVEAARKLADGYGIVLAMIASGCSDPQRFAKRMLAEYEPEAKQLGITK